MTNILLIGDSINLDYGQFLKDYLAPDIHVYGKPGRDEAYADLDIPIGGNGGDSRMVLEFLRSPEAAPLLTCDLFLFNCGLHDVKRSRAADALQVPPEEYQQNLRAILDLTHTRGIPTVFINSTPTATERYGKIKAFYRLTEDVPAYNQLAQEVMASRGVPVIDLYGFTMALGLEGDALFRDHTHFTRPVMQLHAAFLAGYLNAGCHPIV